jgi:SAM-dependent methyltransferase
VAGVAGWLLPALRSLGVWDGLLALGGLEATGAGAGLKSSPAIFPDIGLISLQKEPDDGSGREHGLAAADPRVQPVNYQPPDSDDAAIQRDADYSLQVFTSYCDAIPGGAPALRGRAVLELGPGNNLAASLCLAALGAKAYAADRFSVRWHDDYHPKLYRAVRDALLLRYPTASPVPFDLCLEFKGHPSAAVWQLPCPAESLTLLGDASIDITLSCAVMEHLFDVNLAARELARITREGGYAIHQVDFRDHRDFSRPLEYLLLSQEEFRKIFDKFHGECGNRVRPDELAASIDEAGFHVEKVHVDSQATPEYLAEFVPRLRAASDSEYRDWPEEKLRAIGTKVVARRLATPPTDSTGLPVLRWTRALSDRFWQRVSGTDYLLSKAFSPFPGEELLDLLRNVLRKDWKYVVFGSGAHGLFVEKMLHRGLPCAACEPLRTDTSRPYPFANHPLYLGEAAAGRDGEFDCALVTTVIEHVHDEDFPNFMRRVRALLKPGGIVIFTTPNREDLQANSVFCPVAEVLFHPRQHLRSWQPEMLEIFLEGYGFAPLAVHQVDFSPNCLELEKHRSLAAMLRWLAENRGSVASEKVSALIEKMHALASDHIPLRPPALRLRGREVQGSGGHLLVIGQPR